MVQLHNHWKSAEFVHRVSTPMPPPPNRGMKREPPVITTTRFKVVAQSAIIRAGYIGVDEDMKLMGNDVWVCTMQRPQPKDDSSSE
ncbi:unnamed protein product [Microthlaspi erraticum]|uniref:Uncharacterized protein n=1 Tax=Microthlaspi erraticum TaxID=1685480 RepID=A0A6D2K311_9BRAS|nr:unnamed protein product [Microthlaspi erraticum]